VAHAIRVFLSSFFIWGAIASKIALLYRMATWFEDEFLKKLHSERKANMGQAFGAFLFFKNLSMTVTWPAPKSDLTNSADAVGCIRYILYKSRQGKALSAGKSRSYCIVMCCC